MSIIKSISRSDTKVLVLVMLVYYAIMAILAPGFFTVNNTWNMLFNLLPLLIIAVGQTLVMLTAGIDLSVTSVVAVSSVVGGFCMSSDTAFIDGSLTIPVAVVSMLLAGALIGLFNGWSVAKLGMPAFMVTLTTMMFFSGLAIWITNSQGIYNLPEAFVNIPYTQLLGLPVPLLIGLAVVSLAYFLLNRTLPGEWIYAVGHSKKVAKISGVAVDSTLIMVYVSSGICAATAAIIYTARLETGSPVMGQNILLDVIGAVVIGGTSLFGGKGSVEWTILGAVFMTMLDNSLNMLGLSFFIIMVVKGMVILSATIANVYREKFLNIG